MGVTGWPENGAALLRGETFHSRRGGPANAFRYGVDYLLWRMAPEGVTVLGPGEVWLHSGRRARSLDSRIFGPIEIARVRGVLEPLLTFGED